MRNKPVIFFDEASWNLWSVKDVKKTWQRSEEPIPIVRNTNRLQEVTFYGAISNIFPRVELMTYHTTNQDGVRLFFLRLLERISELNLNCKPYLVLDNHRAHRARNLADIWPHFHRMYLPTYSSELNSVETVWSVLKDYLNKYFARLESEIYNQEELEEEVEMIMDEWALTANPQSFMFAARKDWLKVLE